jgi:hypothetical protein
MNAKIASGLGRFLPGDLVRVSLGDGNTLRGEVVSVLAAHVLWLENGCTPTSFGHSPGQVCVIVTIHGSRVPMAVDVVQLSHDSPSEDKLDGPTA